MQRALRSHQRIVAGVVEAIATGQTAVADILAAVTPGGGKSLLPVIAGARLIAAGVVDRICWIVPRDSLRLQAEEAFADPAWRAALGHAVTVRAAENAPDPCRGTQGYVTTCQAVAAAPELHRAEFERHRTLLVVDEVHHLPALSDTDAHSAAAEETAWSRAILPLLEHARVRLLLSGTLERADGRPILWLPYRRGRRAAGTREVDLHAPGFAVVGYSRAQALAERAVLPVDFGAMDGEAAWLDEERRHVGPHRVSGPWELARPALFTALRTGFARNLLRRAFDTTRDLRAERRAGLGIAPGDAGAMGLGKLLVVAPDQENARKYLAWLRGWLGPARRGGPVPEEVARIATSDERDAQATLAAFRLRPEPSVLVTVAMAYEGLDAPAVSVCAALTHIRSRAWLEQMIARATRVDPAAGPYEAQRAVVLHPDDLLFRDFRERIEREQGTLARDRRPARRQGELPLAPEGGAREPPIVPLASNATALRWATLAPGPEFAAARPERAVLDFPVGAPVPPSLRERELRLRIARMVAAQVVEDEGALRVPRGGGAHHAYAAALKRVMGKGRAEMSLPELEATVAWLERNRLHDEMHRIAGDPRYDWTVRQRRFDFAAGSRVRPRPGPSAPLAGQRSPSPVPRPADGSPRGPGGLWKPPLP